MSDEGRRSADAVVTAVSDGQLGKAAKLLESPGLAPATSSTASKIKSLLVQHEGREAPPAVWATKRKREAVALDFDTFRNTVRGAKRGSAADLGGWAGEHLQLLLEDADAMVSAHAVAGHLVQGRFTPDCVDLLDLSRCTPLCKKGNGIRPLASAAVWRRVAVGAVMQQERETIAEKLGDSQFAVGRDAGLETLLQHTTAALMKDADRVALVLDCVCAFNSMFRESILEEIEDAAPHLLTVFATWLARPSRTVFFTDDGTAHIYTATCGVDQGCPASPAAFAFGMRRALRRIAEALPESDRAAFFAYLDDLTVVTSASGADAAIAKVEEEFARLGLQIHRGKSFCHSPSGSSPDGPRAAQLWQNAVRHDGFVLCGAPFGNGRTTETMDDLVGIAPFGSDAFIRDFLHNVAEKFGAYTRRVAEIPTSCTPGRPGVQCANALLRQCGVQRVTHLLRTLPPPLTHDFAREIDAHVLRAFEAVNGLPLLAPERQAWACLPLAAGGLGLGNAWELREGAFLGSWCLVKPPPNSTAVPEQVHAAATSLQERLQVDVCECTHASWHELGRGGRKQVQRQLTHAANGSLVSRVCDNLDDVARATMASGSCSPGTVGHRSASASAWLTALPRAAPYALPDEAFRTAVRSRLRLPLVQSQTPCAYRTITTHRVCGAGLTADADHAHGCCRRPIIFRHNALRDLWAALYAEAGCIVDTEQAVPEIGLRPARGQREPGVAIADVRAAGGPGAPVRYADVAVTHPVHSNRGRLVADGPGEAAAAQERAKDATYAPAEGASAALVVPLVFETFGRWGPRAERELLWLARRRVDRRGANTALDPAQAFGAVLRRWRQRVSICLMRGNFEVVRASTCGPVPQRLLAAPASETALWELCVG